MSIHISGHHHAYFQVTGAVGATAYRSLAVVLVHYLTVPSAAETLTVDIKFESATTTYTTYDMTTMNLVDHAKLPRIIVVPMVWYCAG